MNLHDKRCSVKWNLDKRIQIIECNNVGIHYFSINRVTFTIGMIQERNRAVLDGVGKCDTSYLKRVEVGSVNNYTFF